MGHMKRLYNGDSAKPEKRSAPNLARRRKIMVALWYRASQYLGPMWEAQFGGVNDDTIYAWEEVLRSLSEEQIAQGVNALTKWNARFPPTLGQFRELCTVGQRPGNAPRLTHQRDPERSRAAGARELAKMKAILNRAEELAEASTETKEESMRVLGYDQR